MSETDDLITILVIDDEAVIRQSFCDQLEDLNYQVIEAENGRVGIELLRSEHPDLILTDLRMPKMGGLEVIKHGKEIAPDTPIIVISGAGRISDAVEALRRGADDYLVKPVNDLEMLHHTVEKALEKAKLLRENRAYQENLEELVHERTKELEQAHIQMSRIQKMDAVGQLTGGVAHDFNNILGIMLGNLTLLELHIGNNDDSALKRILTIKKSAERAAVLTKQLLSFSRKQAAQVSVTDINQVITEMDNILARSVTPGVEIENRFARDLWLTEIDSGDLEDALLNLVINARDAMQGGGRVVLETSNYTFDEDYCEQNPGTSPGDYVQLTVSDSGCGVPDELQDRIFEPFFTTKPQGKGTGLGLAMVFGFTKRSLGYIKVISELGSGTSFQLFFPRGGQENKFCRSVPCTQVELPGGTESILVVDDELGLLELAQESLETLGYRILVASSGLQALERLEGNPDIQLLFSDVLMPGGMNGYELAEAAAELRPDLKMLLTSGYTGNVVTHNRQHNLNVNLLKKPYTLSNLAPRIRSLLDQK